MAISFYFVHNGFTPAKYADAIKQLEAAGQGAPKGRSIHVALDNNGEVAVFDVWESQADFENFGAVLIPILTDLGVTLNDPMVAPVHGVILG